MVVLLVDALGWELARRTPGFAAVLGERRRLDTVLGFSSGALPTLFTGQGPAAHGRFVMYRRATSPDTPFRHFQWLGLLPPRLQRSWKLSRVLARGVAARGVRGYFQLYDVPRPLLAQFDLPERGDPFAPGGLPVDSLWDALDQRGVRWKGWNWRGDEARHLAALEHALATGDERFLFCYTAELDALLHREGSRGAGVAARLQRYDAWLARIAARAAADRVPTWIYLLSDHGMVDVDTVVDVRSRLAALPVRMPHDYLAFFDSTMARFWWRTPDARAQVRAALDAGSHGRWLESAERGAAGITDPAWGEDIFLLAPGALLCPSFMGRSPVRAMHGYDPAHPDMAALLMSNRPIPPGVRHLTDVRGFLESELDALAPSGMGAA